jgi:glutathione S-transferase
MVRFIMNEVEMEYILVEQTFWNCDDKFLRINNMGTVPVLITDDNLILNHHQLIIDYIYSKYEPDFFYPQENDTLAIRKVSIWFNEKFYLECTKYFLHEKLVKPLNSGEQPNTNVLSLARYNLGIHLEYLTHLLEYTSYLAGDKFSIADISAAMQISSLDFLGEIQWSKIPRIKDWYSIIKSKPSFRKFLKERIVGIQTPSHYSILDF